MILNSPVSPKTSNGRKYKQSSITSNQQEGKDVFVKKGRSEIRHHNNMNSSNNIRLSSNDTTVKQHVN